MKQVLHTYLTRIFFSLTLIFAINSFGQAQMKFETGINVGPSNFLGDLGGTMGKGRTFIKDNNFAMTRLMKGVFFSVAPTEFVNFRVSLSFGRLEGADSVINGKGGMEEMRKFRNLSFRSNIAELYAGAEFYPTVFFEQDGNDVFHKIRPYGIIGVGVFHFNPQTVYTDPSGNKQWVNLHDLHTEGQGMPNHPDRKQYSLTQVNVPYGIGIKYFISEKFNIGFEIINRKTFTDYIDDVSTKYVADQDFYNYFGAGSHTADIAVQVANRPPQGAITKRFEAGSQRGTPTNNDAYYATTVKLGIRLGGDGESNRHSLNKTRCPIIRF
jgi:hypothetical protein